MKPNRTAQKARLVESSPSDEPPLTEDGVHSSASILEAAPLERAPIPKCSGENIDTDGTSKTSLEHFPNIDILPAERRHKASSANSFFQYFVNTRHNKLAVIATSLLVCGIFLADRMNKESTYRQAVDQAELHDISGNYPEAVKSWKAAVALATKLGDGDKTIADLYVRLAQDQTLVNQHLDSLQGDEAASQSLEQAIALYKKVPYTIPQQARAKERLLNTLPAVLKSDLAAPGYETTKSESLLNNAYKSLDRNEIDSAIEYFKEYVELSNDPFAGSANVEFTIWEKLEASISQHSELAQKAIPLMFAMVYAEKFVPASPTALEPLAQLQSNYRLANILVDRTIVKTGQDPRDFQTMKRLGDQLSHSNEFKAASVAYMRCLAIKNDAEVKESLKACYRRLHPGSMPAAQKQLSVLADLHKLFAQAFGEKSEHVTKTLALSANIYLYTGEFAKAEALLNETIGRTVTVDHRKLRANYALTSWNCPEFAYDELFKFYVLTGEFAKARALYLQASNDDALDKTLLPELQENYVKFCGKSNRMNDPVLSGIKDFKPIAQLHPRRF